MTSDAMPTVHDIIEGLTARGVIYKQTMSEFDAARLAPAPEVIKAIRKQQSVSQPVLARYLNVSKNVLFEWKCGTKQPGAAAVGDCAVKGVESGNLVSVSACKTSS